MTKSVIEHQIGVLLSLYTLLLRATELIRLRVSPMMEAIDRPFTYEDKKYLRILKDGIDKVRIGAEYFEKDMLKNGRTKSGSTDVVELYDAMSRDANDFVRFNISLFNARVNNIENQEKMENLIHQYEGIEPIIKDEIRESFRLKEYE